MMPTSSHCENWAKNWVGIWEPPNIGLHIVWSFESSLSHHLFVIASIQNWSLCGFLLVIEVFCLHHYFCCKYSKFKNIFIVFIMLHFFIGYMKGGVEEFHYILNNSWNILTCNCSNIGAKIDFFPKAWTLSRLVEKKKKEEERNKGELKD
jgi:hypothetical protein